MAHTVLVVGAGARGHHWIREVSGSLSWELAGVVETDPGVLALATDEQETGPIPGFNDLASALTATSPTAAILATPAELHYESALECLEAGCALLIEKPFADNLARAAELVTRAEEANVPILVGQNYRYMRAHRTARKVVAGGRLGRVLLVDARYYRVPHGLSPSMAASPWSVTWGMAVHHLDALRHVLGKEVAEVTATSSTLDPDRNPPGATLQVLLGFEGGARASYSATYESSGHQFFEGGQEFYERIVGDEATLHMFQRWLFLCANGKLPRPLRRGKRAISEETVLLGELSKAIAGESYGCSGRDNLKTMAVVEACMRSSDEKRSIDPRDLLVR